MTTNHSLSKKYTNQQFSVPLIYLWRHNYFSWIWCHPVNIKNQNQTNDADKYTARVSVRLRVVVAVDQLPVGCSPTGIPPAQLLISDLKPFLKTISNNLLIFEYVQRVQQHDFLACLVHHLAVICKIRLHANSKNAYWVIS